MAASPTVQQFRQKDGSHAFLTYCEEEYQVAAKMYEDLTDAGFNILFAPVDFLAGTEVSKNIRNCIARSRRVIHLYSKNFAKSKWCKQEMAYTHNQEYDDGIVKSIYVLYKMEKSEVEPGLQHLISDVVMAKLLILEYDSENFWEKLCENIAADEVPLNDVLPFGNIAQGLAWNYFYGYFNVIFKETDEKISKCRYYSKDPSKRRMSKRMLILIPESCHCYSTLQKGDKRITTLTEKLETITANRAGNYKRPYNINIHEIKCDDGEKYYFIGEFAPQLLTLQRMQDGGIAGMSEGEKNRQVHIFYHTLKHIFSNSNVKHCNNKAYIHMYKDRTEDGKCYPLAEELVKIIKQEIEKDIRWDQKGLKNA